MHSFLSAYHLRINSRLAQSWPNFSAPCCNTLMEDLSQRVIAEYLHIHQTTYSDYELERLNVPAAVLDKLADYYGTSVDYLLGRTSCPAPYPT